MLQYDGQIDLNAVVFCCEVPLRDDEKRDGYDDTMSGQALVRGRRCGVDREGVKVAETPIYLIIIKFIAIFNVHYMMN